MTNAKELIGKSFRNRKTNRTYVIEDVNDTVVTISNPDGEITSISLNFLIKNCEALEGTLQVESLICG